MTRPPHTSVSSPKNSLDAHDLRGTLRAGIQWLVATGLVAAVLTWLGTLQTDEDATKTIFVGVMMVLCQQLIARYKSPPVMAIPDPAKGNVSEVTVTRETVTSSTNDTDSDDVGGLD